MKLLKIIQSAKQVYKAAIFELIFNTMNTNKFANKISKVDNRIIRIYSFKMKDVVSSNAKRDWKHNEVVHKAIHRGLDDCLFDLFDEIYHF